MTDTAYAIVSGEYSDYRVHAVFTTRELAEKQLFAYDDNLDAPEIEEFPLNPEFPERPAGMSAYSCTRYSSGVIRPQVLAISDAPDFSSITEYPAALQTHVFARSKDHAIKIASERFTRYNAEQAGIA